MKSSTKLLARIKQAPLGPNLPCATRYVDLETARSLVRDSRLSLSPSDRRDLFHMIVPLAYCDFILLDRAWAGRAKAITQRLRECGHTAEFAQVFHGGEMEKFWSAFETVDSKTDALVGAAGNSCVT